VRNFLNPQFYLWEIVHGLSFPKNSRTARLELPYFEFVSMWAFQAADGNRVVDAVNNFRLLEDAYLPED
ncbi:MAG: PH domain-containing protein, partial [Corynebacterium kroppenstedtii]|nr:PH domain-containing protein [Corynebacterium kroppenstedtii]